MLVEARNIARTGRGAALSQTAIIDKLLQVAESSAGKAEKAFEVMKLIDENLPCLMQKKKSDNPIRPPVGVQTALLIWIRCKNGEEELVDTQEDYINTLTSLEGYVGIDRFSAREYLSEENQHNLPEIFADGREALNKKRPLDRQITVAESPFPSLYLKIPLPFDEHFSVWDMLSVRATCKMLHTPYHQTLNGLIQRFNPRTTESSVECSYDLVSTKLLLAHPHAKQTGLGNYTLQQISERRLTFGVAEKLNNLIKQYSQQTFRNQDEQTQWVNNHIHGNDDLKKYLVPGCDTWWRFKPAQLDLELALLLCSADVKKYSNVDDPNDLCDKIIVRSTKFKGVVVEHVKYRLAMFSDPVIQSYLNPQRISVDDLIQLSVDNSDKGIEWMRDPIIKDCYDAGCFGPVGNKDTLSGITQKNSRSNKDFLAVVRSPLIQKAYHEGKLDCWTLNYLRTHKYDLIQMEYIVKYVESDKMKFNQFITGNERMYRFFQKWVLEEIQTGKLTVQDVLDDNATYKFRAAANWF